MASTLSYPFQLVSVSLAGYDDSMQKMIDFQIQYALTVNLFPDYPDGQTNSIPLCPPFNKPFLSTSSWDLRPQSVLFLPPGPDVCWCSVGGAAAASYAALHDSDQ